MREVYARSGEELDIGRRGENLATRVIFDVAEWESLYGEGIFHLLHRRNGDKYPYPVVTAYEPGRVIWDVSKTDLAVVGKGLAELQYWAGETRVKSAVFSTRTATSLDNEGPYPDEPEASWVEKILAAAGSAGDYNAGFAAGVASRDNEVAGLLNQIAKLTQERDSAYQDGYAAGYAAGYADGYAACSPDLGIIRAESVVWDDATGTCTVTLANGQIHVLTYIYDDNGNVTGLKNSLGDIVTLEGMT